MLAPGGSLGEHCHHVLIHLVFSTKERLPLIQSDDMAKRLHAYIAAIVTNHNLGHPIRIGGVADHIHALLQIRMTTSIADLVRTIKTSSSTWAAETFDTGRGFAWQAGYGAFSVSCSNQQQVMRYIDNQAVHHRRQDFRSELLQLLDRHGIAYDKRYLFD